MEKYILDTCTWIEYFHERNGVPEQARKVGRKNLCASEVTLAELTYGASIAAIMIVILKNLKNCVEI